MDAWLNFGKTIFVILVLTLGAIMFTRDAELLVIGPIEHMVKMVQSLAEDPSGKMKVHNGKLVCVVCVGLWKKKNTSGAHLGSHPPSRWYRFFLLDSFFRSCCAPRGVAFVGVGGVCGKLGGGGGER